MLTIRFLYHDADPILELVVFPEWTLLRGFGYSYSVARLEHDTLCLRPYLTAKFGLVKLSGEILFPPGGDLAKRPEP